MKGKTIRRRPRYTGSTNMLDRFWAKVDTSGECWTWQGARSSRDGRAWVSLGRHGAQIYGYRFTWMLHSAAEIPEGMYICHTCDNPLCVRPEHLFLGTPTDNTRDMVSKDRENPWGRSLTHCKHGHPLTGANVLVHAREGGRRRRCLACRCNEYMRRNGHRRPRKNSRMRSGATA